MIDNLTHGNEDENFKRKLGKYATAHLGIMVLFWPLSIYYIFSKRCLFNIRIVLSVGKDLYIKEKNKEKFEFYPHVGRSEEN